MSLGKKLFKAVAADGGGTGNQEEGLILHLDANDVDSYDGDGSIWYDITDHEYTPATDVSEHFNTVLYTGNGTTNSTEQSITGVGFQPDLVWIKNRGEVRNHVLVDSLRKTGNLLDELHTNTTDVANTTGTDNVKTVDSDGFTVLGQGSETNDSGDTFVAWCMKAGGAPTSSNPIFVDGTGYATLSAAGLDDSTNTNYTNLKLSVNTDLGFSIVTANAPINPATARLPHGLGQEPEMVIHKALGNTYDWGVWHKDLSTKNYRLRLNQNAAQDQFSNANGGYWTAVNSTDVMYLQDSADRDQVYYSFVSKRGVSKVGSYTGSTGSVKVYTGFEPAFVMIKNRDVAGDPWVIFDNKRGDNGEYDYLYPSENYAEGAGDSTLNSGRTGITFNRDGFTLDDDDSHSVNESGKKHIYLAFAKSTKETSLIDDTDLVMHLDAGDDNSYNGSGTTWSDLANSNDATITGASWDKELGNWFDFGDDLDELSWSATTSLGTNRTAEMWVNFDNFDGQWLFDSMPHYAATNTFGDYGIYIDSNYIYAASAKWNGSSYGAIKVNNSMTTKKWHHLVYTVGGSTNKLYIDGVEQSRVTDSTYADRTAASVTLSNIIFGNARTGYTNHGAGTYSFNGKLGQFRIYNSTLTESQIRQNFNFTKNDYPNGFNGTLVSGASPTFSTDHFDFVRGSITGGSDQVVFNSAFHSYLKSTSEGTITAWIKVDAVAGRCSIFATGHTSDNNDWAIFRTTTSRTLHFSINNGGTANGFFTTSTSEITTGSYIHVAMSVNSAGIGKMYINGVSQAVSYQTGSSSQWFSDVGTNTVTIGSFDRGSSGQFYDGFDGEISQVKFYNRVLTDTEISDQHTAGR